MKKIKTGIVFLLISFLFSSCSQTICYDGFEIYRPEAHSEVELNVHLLPTNDFDSRFEYVDIDYHFRAHYKTPLSLIGTEKTIVIIEYEQSVYEKAKEFCLEEMKLSDSNIIEYNGYIFIENIKLAVAQDRYKNGSSTYPEDFNMFAYNEELNVLVFMGYYNAKYSAKDAEYVSANWGEFLEENFSDLYDFNTGNGSLN